MVVNVVTNSSNDLDEVIGCLKAAEVLTLDCEGVDLGRSGELCLIQLATRERCFLFDVHELATACCDMVISLKEILEDNTIVKVVHDCKMDSDALFHHLGIRLANVHDTQAWDKVLRNSVGENLNRTLLAFDCTPNVVRDCTIYSRNIRFWATRPLTPKMIEWASGDVSSLFELRDKQCVEVSVDVREKANTMSEANICFLRDAVTDECRIRHVGRFIGPGGSNIRALMKKIPGTFFQQRGGTGRFMVYAPDRVKLAAGLQLLTKYQ